MKVCIEQKGRCRQHKLCTNSQTNKHEYFVFSPNWLGVIGSRFSQPLNMEGLVLDGRSHLADELPWEQPQHALKNKHVHLMGELMTMYCVGGRWFRL